MDFIGVFEVWFRPKAFESERLYERLGALLIKRYVPTGGDLVMRRLRRDQPQRRWVNSSFESLRLYERRTRLNESIHLIGFTGFAVVAGEKFLSGSIVLQRSNRLRLYRAIDRCSQLPHRRSAQ